MANGEVLEELRNIVAEAKTLPAKYVSRLTLAALAEVLENQKIASTERKEILDNPMVQLGKRIKENKKIALTVFVALMFILVVPHIAQIPALIADARSFISSFMP